MQIPKDKVLELIRSKVGGDKASQAEGELPEQVDTENSEHQSLLEKFGVNPSELLGSGGSALGL